MATFALKTDMQTVGTGLNTWTITVPTAGIYHASARVEDAPPTGISLAIALNGTNVIASGTLNPNASVIALDCFPKCAAGDVITVVTTSSASPDASVQTMKVIMNVRAGI